MRHAVTFGQRTHERSQVICLFQFSSTNFDDIRQIFSNLVQKLPTYKALAGEKAIQRVLIVSRLSRQESKLLKKNGNEL